MEDSGERTDADRWLGKNRKKSTILQNHLSKNVINQKPKNGFHTNDPQNMNAQPKVFNPITKSLTVSQEITSTIQLNSNPINPPISEIQMNHEYGEIEEIEMEGMVIPDVNFETFNFEPYLPVISSISDEHPMNIEKPPENITPNQLTLKFSENVTIVQLFDLNKIITSPETFSKYRILLSDIDVFLNKYQLKNEFDKIEFENVLRYIIVVALTLIAKDYRVQHFPKNTPTYSFLEEKHALLAKEQKKILNQLIEIVKQRNLSFGPLLDLSIEGFKYEDIGILPQNLTDCKCVISGQSLIPGKDKVFILRICKNDEMTIQEECYYVKHFDGIFKNKENLAEKRMLYLQFAICLLELVVFPMRITNSVMIWRDKNKLSPEDYKNTIFLQTFLDSDYFLQMIKEQMFYSTSLSFFLKVANFK